MLIRVNLVYLVFQCLLCEISASNIIRNGRRYETINPLNYNNEYDYQNSRNKFSNFEVEHFNFPLRIPFTSNIERIPNPPWDPGLLYNDRLDFHYPNVEFLTTNRRKYTFDSPENMEEDFLTLKNQKFAQESVTRPKPFNRKSTFKKQIIHKNDLQYHPVKLSYKQKVPKPLRNTSIENKYKEYEVNAESSEQNDTKNETKTKLHEFLKNYLLNLFSSKYNNSVPMSLKRSNFSKLENSPNDEAENKFIGGVLSKFKKKAVHKNKLFSLFTIVQFNNTQCNATSASMSYIGVCYTPQECTSIEGTAVGNCASGYGVGCAGKKK